MRSRWGSEGRINIIGTLCLEGQSEWLQYSVIEGSCRSEEVLGYLEALAEQAEAERTSVVWWSSWTTLRFTLQG